MSGWARMVVVAVVVVAAAVVVVVVVVDVRILAPPMVELSVSEPTTTGLIHQLGFMYKG